MKYLTLAAALLICGAASAEHFKVIAPMGKDDDGAMAYLINYDTTEPIDSALVADGVVTFEGEIDEPITARVTIDGGRMPVFILESGTISFNAKEGAFGTMLNDQMREFFKTRAQLGESYNKAAESERGQIMERYHAMIDSIVNANRDNALGYLFFLNSDASQASAAELRDTFKQYPEFAKYKRSQALLASAEKREATQPGNKYVDFEVPYDGKTYKLSDYIEPGKYTLVDFWASWCGPCMRQAPVLKSLYEKYHDKGPNIVGVAVWDEPENTLAAIKSHGLTWPNIIGAQTIPTDLYGISGIPCIMLIGPDGTILSRDKQGDELVADVEKYIK